MGSQLPLELFLSGFKASLLRTAPKGYHPKARPPATPHPFCPIPLLPLLQGIDDIEFRVGGWGPSDLDDGMDLFMSDDFFAQSKVEEEEDSQSAPDEKPQRHENEPSLPPPEPVGLTIGPKEV